MSVEPVEARDKEPVTVEDLGRHLNLSAGQDELTLGEKIRAARLMTEAFVGPIPSEPAEVPEDIKEAVRLLAAHLYENREAVLVGVSGQEMPFGYLALISPYRNWVF